MGLLDAHRSLKAMGYGNLQALMPAMGMQTYGLPMVTQGKAIYVKPYTGSDNNRGNRPDRAVKTLTKALALATANQNDVVYFFSESNTAANTTDYLSANLDWNKDMVHIIGINAGCSLDQRSRVAWDSTNYDGTATPLFTLSADSCFIANIQFMSSINDAQALGSVDVTGDRNKFFNCHIAGIGNDTQDAAGAYSLYLNGVQSSEFERCFIGLNTTAAGTAANSEILMANTIKNVIFKDCFIYRRIEHATNHPLVKVAAATSLEEFVFFDRCKFISMSTNNAFSNASAFKFAATPTQGYIFVDNCLLHNGATAGKWDVDDLDRIVCLGHPTPAADTCNIGRLV